MFRFQSVFILFTVHLWLQFSRIDSQSCIDSDIDPPNIIYFLLDDLGYTDIGGYGSEFDTPNLDSVYSSAIRVNYHYVGTLCSVSRSMFLTGRYAWNLGFAKMTPFQQTTISSIPLGVPTIADLFKQYTDYNTYMIGKWHVGQVSYEMLPLQRGFDSFKAGFLGDNINYVNKTNTWSLDGGRILEGIDWYDDNDVVTSQSSINTFATTAGTDAIVDIINEESSKNNNYFIFASLQVPHRNLVSVESDQSGKCNKVNPSDNQPRYIYCLNLQVLDVGIGEVVNALKSTQTWNNTLIIFTTDNGGDLDALEGCNYPFRGGKATYFEGGIRVQTWLGGGYIQKNFYNSLDTDANERDELFHIVDWLPSLLSIAGADMDTVENDLLNGAYSNIISTLNSRDSQKITAFDGIDQSCMLLTNEISDDTDRRYIAPLNIANLDDTDNDNAIVFRSVYDDNIYKYLNMQRMQDISSSNFCVFVTLDGNVVMREVYDTDTKIWGQQYSLFDISNNFNESDNIYSDNITSTGVFVSLILNESVTYVNELLKTPLYIEYMQCTFDYDDTLRALAAPDTDNNNGYWKPFLGYENYISNLSDKCDSDLNLWGKSIYYSLYNNETFVLKDANSGIKCSVDGVVMLLVILFNVLFLYM